MAVNSYYFSMITELLILDLIWCKFKGMLWGVHTLMSQNMVFCASILKFGLCKQNLVANL
jgi:hypothetical protein